MAEPFQSEWLERISQSPKNEPTEPTKAISVSFVSDIVEITQIVSGLRGRISALEQLIDDIDTTAVQRKRLVDERHQLADKIGARMAREQAQRREQWERNGYVVVLSELLGGELVVVMRTPHVRVPAELNQLTRYTILEVSRLDGASDSTIRDVHRVKKVFGGNIAATEPEDG